MECAYIIQITRHKSVLHMYTILVTEKYEYVYIEDWSVCEFSTH
jgi:hypothetical protein